MKQLVAIILALALSACEDWKASFGDLTLQTPLTITTVSTGAVEDARHREEVLREACRLVREGMGLPIVVDPQRRSEAYAALGREKTNNLLWPIARSNNSFRCVCGTPEEKLKAKCPAGA